VTIDKQLAGASGRGARLYRSGPWRSSTPSRGYLLPFAPAEPLRTSLAAITRELSHAGTPFPYLAGQHARCIGLRLKMRELGFRNNILDAMAPDVMADVAKRLEDQDIAAVAAHFEQANACAQAALRMPRRAKDYPRTQRARGER